MKARLQFHVLVAALLAASALVACSDDDDNGPAGPGDTTPPTASSVTAVDANHIDVRYSEMVDRESAESESNYSIVETGVPLPSSAPGDPVAIVSASLKSDNRTVVLTTATALVTTGYELTINGVEDTDGNTITEAVEKQFLGTDDGDETPAEVVYRNPTSNETGVDRVAPIEITFSEPVQSATVDTGVALTLNGNPVDVTVTTTDQVHYTIQPLTPLGGNVEYTITLTGAQDMTGNLTQDVVWSFRTAMDLPGDP
jgi:hypothetical protein